MNTNKPAGKSVTITLRNEDHFVNSEIKLTSPGMAPKYGTVVEAVYEQDLGITTLKIAPIKTEDIEFEEVKPKQISL